jgi:hypothetical protein
MLATAFCASEAAHTAATSWLILVVVMIIGMDARNCRSWHETGEHQPECDGPGQESAHRSKPG